MPRLGLAAEVKGSEVKLNGFPKPLIKGYRFPSHFASPVRVVRAVTGVASTLAARFLYDRRDRGTMGATWIIG